MSLLLCATMLPFAAYSSGHAEETSTATDSASTAKSGESPIGTSDTEATEGLASSTPYAAEGAADVADHTSFASAEDSARLFADFDNNLIASPCGSLAASSGEGLVTEAIGDSQWSSNWADWSQGSFSEWGARQNGCWVVAQARMIAACGAASTSSFNPEVYLSWEKQNGYINGSWEQINGANAPVAYTSGRSKSLNHVSTVWSNCESQVWSNISKGYYSIIVMGGNNNSKHFVMVNNAASSANGTIMVYESWATSTCVGTKTLSYSMQQNHMTYVDGVYTYSVSGGASGDMTTPNISTNAPAYNVGDTINAWWTPTSENTDFYQYWVIFDNLTTGTCVYGGPSGADGDTNAYSINVKAPSAGRYRITVYAVPYNDKDSRQKASVAYVSVGAYGEIATPSISTNAPAYNVGDTINAWWTPTSENTDFYQYWVVFENTTTGANVFSGPSNETPGAFASNSINVKAPSAGRYRITVYAVPYNQSANGTERGKSSVAYVSVGAYGEITTPSISTSQPSYTVGDTINAWWTPTSENTDFYQYWVVFENTTTGVCTYSRPSNETPGAFASNSVNVTAPSAGRYRITVHAVPYNQSADGTERGKSSVAYVSVGQSRDDLTQGTVRLAGNTRYDTMANIVKSGASSADTVILASGEKFPDALSASALAGAYSAPVVLTDANALSPQALETISSLNAKHVVIMGGMAAISATVESTLTAAGLSTERVDGMTRQDTSIKALDKVAKAKGAANTVIIASGNGFADSLSASPYSYAKCAPVVLANGDGSLSDSALSAIRSAGANRAIIVGGNAVVSEQAERSLASAGINVERWAGNDRYETSAIIAEHELAEGLSVENCAVATGENYPDALAGGALLGKQRGVLLLAADGHTTAIDKMVLPRRDKVCLCRFLGGTGAVSSDIENYVQRALNQ